MVDHFPEYLRMQTGAQKGESIDNIKFGMVDHFFIRQWTPTKGIIRRFLECMDSSRM